MLGAIIGDVVGSIYEVLEVDYLKKNHMNRPYEERIKILDKSTPLFTSECSVTDDSILTYSIYDAIKNGNSDYETYLRKYGTEEVNLGVDRYGRSRFGRGFTEWLKGDYQGESYGNGAAMRVSAVGYLFNDIEEVKKQARLSCLPSHNHEEAIKGAEAVAVSIFLLRNGYTKEQVIDYIKKNYYSLDYDLEDLQRNYKFSSRTSESIPQALYIFSISNDFEDAIRKAISIGGDADTIAAIVGSLSEAYYGISDELIEGVKPYLRDYMMDLTNKYNSSQLDIWFINKEPEAIETPLKQIVNNKNKIKKDLNVFVNCMSRFIVDGKEVERYAGTVVTSTEADIALCVTNNSNVTNEEGVEVNATQRIVDTLSEEGIPYRLVFGLKFDDRKENPNIPETWMIREEYVLKDALEDSKSRGDTKCTIYPDSQGVFEIGYYEKDGSFHKVWGVHFKGIIETNSNWALLIQENDKRNMTIEEAIKLVEESGMSYSYGESPVNSEMKL